jgi:hypothetical protein
LNNFFKKNRTVDMAMQAPWFGLYSKQGPTYAGSRILASDLILNGGRPIYAGPNNYYLFYSLEAKTWGVGLNYTNASGVLYAHDNHMPTLCPENAKGWKINDPSFNYLVTKESSTFVMDPSVVDFAQRAKRERRFVLLKSLHLQQKTRKDQWKTKQKEKRMKQKEKRMKHRHILWKRAQMFGNTTIADEMSPQDMNTTDEATSDDIITVDENNTAADETVVEDATLAGEMPNELEETEATENNPDAETPQVTTTADETATADTAASDEERL